MITKLLVHPVVLTLIEKDVELTVCKEGISIDGFYKSGTIRLVVNERDELIAHSRYQQEDTIETFEDLVHLNYEWWQQSKNRSSHWKKPETEWGDFMAEIGLVKKRVENVVHYE